MKLVIVESPTKSKTIGQYLGKDYHVEASVGHIRDLAISGVGGFGVDVEHDFKPTYVIDSDKKDVVVFGDDYNDLVMFDKDWMSIAMGNACDALKAKADFVTKKNVEDGIYYACEKFHWFDNVELECR